MNDTLTSAKEFLKGKVYVQIPDAILELMAAFADKHAGEVLDEFIKRASNAIVDIYAERGFTGEAVKLTTVHEAMASVAAEMKGNDDQDAC